MRIDSHQHFWKYDPVVHAWITPDMNAIAKDFLPEDLLPLLQAAKIDGCVAVQADQSEAETHFLLTLADRNPFIQGVVGWVDLRAANLDERLEYYSQFKKLKGFRHVVQGEPKGFLANGTFMAGVRKLARYNFTYDILIYHHQLDEAVAFARAIDNVKMVVDHVAKPAIREGVITPWNTFIGNLAGLPHVSCKVSGMVTEASWQQWKPTDFTPYLDRVFEAFGAQRLLYGSDWPVCQVAATYSRQLALVESHLAAYSATEQQLVMGGNAQRFYNL